MKAILIGTAIALGLAAPALAAHNHPEKAKGVKINFVTAYNQCSVPSLDHRPPFGMPDYPTLVACPQVLSTEADGTNKVTFATDGRLSASIKVAKEDVKISFKGEGILNNATAYSGALEAIVVVRVTDAACGGPAFITSCTLIDFPFSVTFGCTNGACKGKTTANAVIPAAIQEGDEGNIEVQQVVVRDPDGDDCFRMGLFVP